MLAAAWIALARGAEAAPGVMTKFNGCYTGKGGAVAQFDCVIAGSSLSGLAVTTGGQYVFLSATVRNNGQVVGDGLRGNVSGAGASKTILLFLDSGGGRRSTVIGSCRVATTGGFAPASLRGKYIELVGNEIEEDTEFYFFTDTAYDDDGDETYYGYSRLTPRTARLNLAFIDEETVRFATVLLIFTTGTSGAYTFVDNTGFYGSGLFDLYDLGL